MSLLLPSSIYTLARPFLFGFDPEHAHELTLDALARTQNTPVACAYAAPRVDDRLTLAGLRFPNRIGLAAGLDKNARCIDAFAAMGFGFVEVGTVTPKAQSGNPRPRMFRLPQRQALINRLGFNNEGLDAFLANVQRARFRRESGKAPMLLGLNIGKNAATPIERAVDDYLICLDGVYPHADETGGLSGAPLRDASNRVIAQLRSTLGADFPIIGVGGVLSGADAEAKVKAGADLVQIYTGLIYKGPALVREAALALRRRGR